MKIETFYFKDDGNIPNSNLPLMVYKEVVTIKDVSAEWFEEIFAKNNWANSWRWGVYPFHHYHSNTHEVLGVFKGDAVLMMGGEKGKELKVKAGDVLLIPAGVGHKCLKHSDDFTVVGAYPDGLSPDLMRGEKSDRPKAGQNIAKVKIPKLDPIFGNTDGIIHHWNK